jgi:hypothetical protein
MLPPTHSIDPRDLVTLCDACKGLCRRGDLVRGVCPECPGVRACLHCLAPTEELDRDGHCEGCCEGVFVLRDLDALADVPDDARADLDALADATFARMAAEDPSPALDALPWECWWGADLDAVSQEAA